jgi:hypothetical protein
MYRSQYNNGIGNIYDRSSDSNRRSTSTPTSSFDQGNDVLKMYQWFHFYGLLTDDAIIGDDENLYSFFFFVFYVNRNVQGKNIDVRFRR